MRYSFTIEVDVDEAELASINKGRTRMQQQLLTPEDAAELAINNMSTKLVQLHSYTPTKSVNFVSSGGDADANL